MPSGNNHSSSSSIGGSNSGSKRKVDEIVEAQPPSIILAAGHAHAAGSVAADVASVNNDNEEQQTVRITARKNEFTKEHYWLVDLYAEPCLKQGATPLVRRCMCTYGWNEQFARRVLKAYRQFLIIKERKRDWNAVLLSPSIHVDEMWQQHILDVNNYIHDCMLLCGHVLGRNPDSERTTKTSHSIDGNSTASSSNNSTGNSNNGNGSSTIHTAASKKGSRYTRTRLALEEYFEEHELDKSKDGVWKEVFHRPAAEYQLLASRNDSFGIGLNGTNDSGIDHNNNATLGGSVIEDINCNIPIIVRCPDEGGAESYYNVRLHSPFSGLFRMHSERTGQPLQYLDFRFNGIRIHNPETTTPASLGMVPPRPPSPLQQQRDTQDADDDEEDDDDDDNDDVQDENDDVINVNNNNHIGEEDEEEEDDNNDIAAGELNRRRQRRKRQRQQRIIAPPPPPIIDVYTIPNDVDHFLHN